MSVELSDLWIVDAYGRRWLDFNEVKSRAPLTADRLRELLTYDPDNTGEFRWRARRGRQRAGRLAGNISHGRVIIQVDGRPYEAGQLAHLYMAGDFAPEIDHRDLNPLNNRWGNLRRAITHSHNLANTRVRASNKLGVKGVCRLRGKFRADIQVNGRRKHLGNFSTIVEASMAYEAAAVAAWGEFARVM